MKAAFALFAASFLISTIFVAPFLKYSEEEKRTSAQNLLIERIDKLTQSNQVLLSEKEQLVNRIDTYAIVAGLTNHSFNQKIETFFKEYEELKSRIPAAPRHLTMDQRAILLDGLKRIGTNGIAIRVAQGSREAGLYADEFTSVFIEAGWTNRTPTFLFSIREPPGIKILYNSSTTNAPQVANEVYQVLLNAGLQVSGTIVPGLPVETFDLFIGFQP